MRLASERCRHIQYREHAGSVCHVEIGLGDASDGSQEDLSREQR